MESYKDLYLNIIEKNTRGLKLILGGTGLGKTYGLREAIKEQVQKEDPPKFIYLTNRHNLIVEQEEWLSNQYKIKTAYLKSNADIIKCICKDQAMDLSAVIDKLENLNYFVFDPVLRNPGIREARLNKLIRKIKLHFEMLNSELDNNILSTIEADFKKQCRDLYRLLKNQMALIYKNDKAKHRQLLDNQLIWRLFPYVAFEKDPDCHVLLVTIQKVLKGFFNGQKDMKLASVEDKVIFMDEFDFLEPDILEILCDEPTIVNPLEFVRIFYEKFKHWARLDTVWESSNKLRDVRDKFNEVIDFIERDCEDKGIDLLNNFDFRLSSEGEFKKLKVLFQAQKVVTPNPFSIEEKDNTWIIHENPATGNIGPSSLFGLLTIATRKIIGVFNYYKNDLNLIDELIHKIWNQKNDNQAGVYEKYIRENMQYHRSRPSGNLTKEVTGKPSSYEFGYRLLKLFPRVDSIDSKSADISQVELFATPEYLVAKLADKNLVFALSATSDLPRRQRCFNIEWLKSNAEYIDLEIEEKQLIQKLRNKKANARKTEVNLIIVKPFKADHLFSKKLNSLSSVGFFESEEKKIFLKERLSKTLHVITQALESDKFSFLLFLTTFKQIRKFLARENPIISDIFPDDLIHVQPINTSRSSKGIFYQINYMGKTVNIALINADNAKKLEQDKTFLEEYKSIFKADKVIVITQYNSASNGINLPCFKDAEKSDFESLGLLEERHFWFDNSQEFEKQANIEKQAYWYLWKLRNARQIDRHTFSKHLTEHDKNNFGKPKISAFNNLFKRTEEKTLAALALYHQAIGRIERKSKLMPEVDIFLDESIVKEFWKYLSLPCYRTLQEERDESITSSLILKIQEKVVELVDLHQLELEFKEKISIKDDNDHSKEVVFKFLQEIENVKNGVYSQEINTKIKEFWYELREAILQHDFEKRFRLPAIDKYISIERNLCFETDLVANGELYIKPLNLEIYPEQSINDVFSWQLNRVYELVCKNTVIKNYFEDPIRGYKTGFSLLEQGFNTILTPYIYQSILIGAIGEKAGEALLASQGIDLVDSSELHNTLFEVVDAKVKNLPIYIDFKNFGNYTLDKFAFDKESIDYQPDFDSELFLKKQVGKLTQLRKIDQKARLFIVNLYSEQQRGMDLYDSYGKPVNTINKSSIAIIPSMLSSKNLDRTNNFFNLFIQDVKSYYAKI